jgi:hypothetical protein
VFRMTLSSRKQIWRFGLLLLVAALGLLGIRWATYTRQPLPEAVKALESDDLVEITQEPWLTMLTFLIVPFRLFLSTAVMTPG